MDPHLATHDPPLHSRPHRELILRLYDDVSLTVAYKRSQQLSLSEYVEDLDRQTMIDAILQAEFGEAPNGRALPLQGRG